MSDSRTTAEINEEIASLNHAHAQNETGRDAFVALAHTAFFAASVAFAGDISQDGKIILVGFLLFGWMSSVVGLITLTVSFVEARKAIDARREAIYDANPPAHNLARRLNDVALWSFPVTLICLFTFVAANIVGADERATIRIQATASDGAEGLRTAGASANTGRSEARGGCAPATASPRPSPSASASAPSAEEGVTKHVEAQGAGKGTKED